MNALEAEQKGSSLKERPQGRPCFEHFFVL